METTKEKYGPKLVIGKTTGKTLYDEIIRILMTITGQPWGFVKRLSKVKYLGSENVPNVRVVIIDYGKKLTKIPEGKSYDVIWVENVRYTTDFWEFGTACDLKDQLLGLGINETVKKSLQLWKPSPEYTEFLKYVHEQRNLYPGYENDAKKNPVDMWRDDCIRDHTYTSLIDV